MASHELPPPRKYPGFVDRLPGRGFQRLMIAKHINPTEIAALSYEVINGWFVFLAHSELSARPGR